MHNPRLDDLVDYPFDRLRALLDAIAPPEDLERHVLSVGEPRHPAPSLVAEAIAANAADWNRYPPVDGSPELRRAIADWLTRRYRLAEGAVDPDAHIMPVAGTREALYMAAAVAIPSEPAGPRPVALLPNPFYQVYLGATLMAGAEAVFMSTTAENAFIADPATVAPELLERTALCFLCTPSNPQGAVTGLDALKAAIDLARAHDFVLVIDECYAEIYDRDPPPGGLEACAALGGGFDNVLVFHSLSKRSSVPGLRSGFLAGDPDLIRLFRRLRGYAGATLPFPVMAASTALWRDEAHVEANRALYRKKFDLAERLIGDRWGFHRPAGAFYLWLDVGDGEAAAVRLWRDAAIRGLPGGYLARDAGDGVGNPGASFIRIALIDDLATTERALEAAVKVL